MQRWRLKAKKGGEKMKSKSLLIVFCLIIVMVTFPLLESAQAAPKAEVTRRQTASPYNLFWLFLKK
jgi:hypothetical protein